MDDFFFFLIICFLIWVYSTLCSKNRKISELQNKLNSFGHLSATEYQRKVELISAREEQVTKREADLADNLRNYQKEVSKEYKDGYKAGQSDVQKDFEIRWQLYTMEVKSFDLLRARFEHEKEEAETELTSRQEQFKKSCSAAQSNLTAIPYFAGIIADFDTRELDILAAQLNWGTDQKRLKKVKSIQEIKKETKELIAGYKEAEYQLAYAVKMFPALEDFLSTEYSELPVLSLSDLEEDSQDRVSGFLSKEEYKKLSTTKRNQLALDRYWESHRRTNWQVGRDYEQYVGYRYTKKGYSVEYYGALKGLEDLGRDLIAKKDGHVLIIQCKYWSAKKQIHEKHINQLYGTMMAYCFENSLPQDSVHGVFVTNITLTDTAKRFANYLGIEIAEQYALGKYPCIKCNINHTDQSRIYHLPFDQQYDSCKIDSPGEFYAMTVEEAESAGFRRAYRHFGIQ